MQTRRAFLRRASAALAAASLDRIGTAGTARHPLGAELYTVREQAQTDLAGALAAIRKIGYQQVEGFAAQYSLPAAGLRAMVRDHGLSMPSGHFDYNTMDSRFDYAKTLGLTDMICSVLPRSMWNSVEGFQRAADQFNLWGARARDMGMRFAFHNHNYEFQRFGATTGLDTLMQRSDPKLVFWQMDCYWVAQAGLSPAAMLKKYAGRFASLHLKDLKPGFPSSLVPGKGSAHFTEVGSGILDWKTILNLAAQQRIRYLFVERDSGDLPAMESLRISYRNLEKLLTKESFSFQPDRLRVREIRKNRAPADSAWARRSTDS